MKIHRQIEDLNRRLKNLEEGLQADDKKSYITIGCRNIFGKVFLPDKNNKDIKDLKENIDLLLKHLKLETTWVREKPAYKKIVKVK